MTADRTALNHLLTIQDHDTTLDALRHQRANLPEFEQVAAVEADLATVESEAATVQAERHELERTQKRYEDEVSLLEDRIAEENGKLYGGEVTGAKDLQALQDEIKGLEDRRRLVEDNILDVMEAAEPVDAQLAQLGEKRARFDIARAELLATVDARQAEIDAEIADVESRRAEGAAAVAPDLVAEYERIRSRPGVVGVAKLVGSTCHGCHLELPAVEVDRLKRLPADELIHCEECGCILVRT